MERDVATVNAKRENQFVENRSRRSQPKDKHGILPQRIRDKEEIRRLLNADREWSLYALADLDDDLFPHCDWWAVPDGIAMVFRAISIRPIFVLADAETTELLLTALPEEAGYLNVRPPQLEAAERVYRFRERHQMARMFLEDFQRRAGLAEPLGPEACDEIRQLYASGDGGGISFAPFQLGTGFFRGIRRDGRLVAVAGVQVVSEQEGVAAVGNVFTHPAVRGQGLTQTVTSAVVDALMDRGIRTIGLNVECTNAPAIRAYERLGLRAHIVYFEGPAVRLMAL